jgi:L-asparaginase/Glu-tRNA(Gln) amidotransferase subunit D
MQENNKTLVVITGGTIEALYDPDKGTPYFVPVPDSAEDSCIPAALKELGHDPKSFDVMPLSMLDSKKVWVRSMETILAHATQEGYTKVMVVHGTDTMPSHARYLERRLEEYGQEFGADQLRIVFTGGMQPLRDSDGTWHARDKVDGWRNLQRAMEDLQREAPGVYIEMGEGPWKPKRVDKHVQTDGEGKPDSKVLSSGFVHLPPDSYTEISFD